MNRPKALVSLSAALLAALLLAAAPRPAGADASSDKTSDDWEHHFSGHEMWLTSLDAALARAAKEKKPLLADFFSHT